MSEEKWAGKVVSTKTFKFRDDEAKKHSNRSWGVEWKRMTRYISKNRDFYIALPEWWWGILNKKTVRAKNEDALEDLWRQTWQEYDYRKAHKKKVIAYELLGNVDARVDNKHFKMDNLGLYGAEEKGSTGLALRWHVAWETVNEDGHRKYFLDDYTELGTRYKVNLKVMDYTLEREEFFKEFTRRIAKLTRDLHLFLKESETLQLIIDGGKALPFLGEEKHD